MANLLFATRESDSLRSENPKMSQPSRGLVEALHSIVGRGLEDQLTKDRHGVVVKNADQVQQQLADFTARDCLLGVVDMSCSKLQQLDEVGGAERQLMFLVESSERQPLK